MLTFDMIRSMKPPYENCSAAQLSQFRKKQRLHMKLLKEIGEEDIVKLNLLWDRAHIDRTPIVNCTVDWSEPPDLWKKMGEKLGWK